MEGVLTIRRPYLMMMAGLCALHQGIKHRGLPIDGGPFALGLSPSPIPVAAPELCRWAVRLTAISGLSEAFCVFRGCRPSGHSRRAVRISKRDLWTSVLHLLASVPPISDFLVWGENERNAIKVGIGWRRPA